MQSTIATRIATQPEPARLLFAGMALAAATAVVALAVTFAPSLAGKPASVTVDGSYAQVEAARGQAFSGPAADGSLSQVEATRSGAFGDGGSTAANASYDQIEGIRAQVVLPAADSSYEDIERLRSQR